MHLLLVLIAVLALPLVSHAQNTFGSSGVSSTNGYFSGNVGVGTTSPLAILHTVNGDIILDDTTNSARKFVFRRNSNSYGKMSTDNLRFQITSMGNRDILLGNTSETGIIVKDNTGNVGIGVTSPIAPLEISSNQVFGTTAIPQGSIGLGCISATTWNGTGIMLTNSYISDTVTHRSIVQNSGAMYFGRHYGTNNIPDVTISNSGELLMYHRTNDCPNGWDCNIQGWDMTISSIYYSGLSQRSDKRLKHDIKSLEGQIALNKLMQLRPVSYRWNDKQLGTSTKYGFIAQEVKEVMPELVSIATDERKTESVDYTALIAPAIKAIQELKEENDKLRAEFEEYKRTHP